MQPCRHNSPPTFYILSFLGGQWAVESVLVNEGDGLVMQPLHDAVAYCCLAGCCATSNSNHKGCVAPPETALTAVPVQRVRLRLRSMVLPIVPIVIVKHPSCSLETMHTLHWGCQGRTVAKITCGSV